MSSVRTIGLIGYGKMGKEIFDLFHNKMPESEYVVYLRHDIEEEAEKVRKNLSKALRRKKISEEIYERMMTNFTFTDDLKKLSGCDLIIESVAEVPEVKQNIFGELESITDENCIYASNTSSIKISDVFARCSSNRKTMGIHFFYPVKLSGYIELNDCSDVDLCNEIAAKVGKATVAFNGNYCFYLNQFISYCVASAFIIAEKHNIGIVKSMELLNEIFPIHSLFGMVDSVGLGLMGSGTADNSVERIYPLVDFQLNKLKGYLEAGCPPETGKFIEFIAEKEKDFAQAEVDKEEYLAEMISAILNEVVIAASENSEILVDALNDDIGISEKFDVFYKKYGYDTISSHLENLQKDTLFSSLKIADKSLFDKYFS